MSSKINTEILKSNGYVGKKENTSKFPEYLTTEGGNGSVKTVPLLSLINPPRKVIDL